MIAAKEQHKTAASPIRSASIRCRRLFFPTFENGLVIFQTLPILIYS